MKTLILCGGTGSRLWPVTLSVQKQLIPIANKPILFYIIDSLVEVGIVDIGILSNQKEDTFNEALRFYEKREKIKYTYIDQDKPIGLANAVVSAKEFIDNEKFIMILGDNMYKFSLKKFLDKFNSENVNCSILLKEVENPSQFGVADVLNGKIVDLVEKPKNPPSNLAITGIYAFDSSIFKACENIKSSWRGEYEITDAIKWLLDNSYNVTYDILEGDWKDLGTPEDILKENMNRLIGIKENVVGEIISSDISGKIILEENSKIINSIIRGPVSIGDGVMIENSYIGPYTSLGNNVSISNCQIENSIILDESNISDIDSIIDSSIVEKGSVIKKSTQLRKVSSFLLAKNSLVILE
ncbi:glucose-1-phosphate thymidylyltransferase [Sporanaerobacter acetigenes]|uniref:Glucose-1-phosphate thymidylyltransferase n=1 Tax=Sporanaerobacter acetigenes DSM 13106 TaxID=1123281 RepID=A0A1M5UEF3_9FIRM|nr:glucose-1-phosphate thymidylyltransferase [Sporanaerobacter acetigenes]SHH61414.1 glucose-1-phosphate thymidylyltransferase [Sporanaerobacter acetigenes DSM 13106]